MVVFKVRGQRTALIIRLDYVGYSRNIVPGVAESYLSECGVSGSAFAQTKAVSTYGKFEKPKDYVTIKPGTVSVGVGAYYSGQKDFSSGILVKYFLNESIALRGSLQFGRNFAKGPNPEYIGQGEGSDTGDGTGDRSNPGVEDFAGEDMPEEDPVISKTMRESNFILSLSGEFGYDLSFKFYSKDKMTADNTTTITPHSTMVATNIGFGNSIRGGLRISYYF